MSCKGCPEGGVVEIIKKSAVFLAEAHRGMAALYRQLAKQAKNVNDSTMFSQEEQKHLDMAKECENVVVPEAENDTGSITRENPGRTEENSPLGTS